MTAWTQPELEQLAEGPIPAADDLATLLRLDGEARQALYRAADAVRARYVGDGVHLRGIIEFSNICRLNCNYCGIRKGNPLVDRYRMTTDEIVEFAFRARAYGYPTVVLQAGEDPWFTTVRLCDILRRIKQDGEIAITLSVGERTGDEYRALRDAGCDRYLLRFETADRDLFSRLHPDDDYDRRMGCLEAIRAAGIQLGSGFMIGLPGADLACIARDIRFATELNLDMIGCGPFIPNPDTPAGKAQLLADTEVYFKAISILRLLNPYAHIPATTAFDAIFSDGRNRVLERGANVFMPNITPQRFRPGYQLYPNKPCIDEDGDQCAICTQGRVAGLKRHIAEGFGHSQRPDWQARANLVAREKTTNDAQNRT